MSEKLKITEESLAILDTQLDYQLSDLPRKIRKARDDQIESIQTTNKQYGAVVAGIAGGRLLRILGATVLSTSVPLGTVLSSVIGSSLVSASYAASRVARVRKISNKQGQSWAMVRIILEARLCIVYLLHLLSSWNSVRRTT